MFNRSVYGIIIAAACLTGFCLPAMAAPKAEKTPKAAHIKPEATLNTKVENAVTPGSQFRFEMTSHTEAVALRAHVTGLSDNQKKALDGIAARAGWAMDNPISLELISAHAPGSVKSAEEIRRYLIQQGVADADVSLIHNEAQPEDVIGVNVITYALKPIQCGQRWDNLSASMTNNVSVNYGCSIAANLAAEINDPRQVGTPAASTPVDVNRRNVIMQKYRDGRVTSSEVNDAASAKISQAVK